MLVKQFISVIQAEMGYPNAFENSPAEYILTIATSDQRVLTLEGRTSGKLQLDARVGDLWTDFAVDPLPAPQSGAIMLRTGQTNHPVTFVATIVDSEQPSDLAAVEVRLYPVESMPVSVEIVINDHHQLVSASAGTSAMFATQSDLVDLDALLAAGYPLEVQPWQDQLQGLSASQHWTRLRILPPNGGIRYLTLETGREQDTGYLRTGSVIFRDREPRLCFCVVRG